MCCFCTRTKIVAAEVYVECISDLMPDVTLSASCVPKNTHVDGEVFTPPASAALEQPASLKETGALNPLLFLNSSHLPDDHLRPTQGTIGSSAGRSFKHRSDTGKSTSDCWPVRAPSTMDLCASICREATR